MSQEICTCEVALKWHIFSDTGEASACSFRSSRDRICLVNITGLLRRRSCKGHSPLRQGSLCIFIQVSQYIDHLLGDRSV